MSCLHKEISALPASFWSSAYDAEGVFQVTRSDLGMAGMPAEESLTYDALSRMYILLHDAVDDIDQKLRSLQSGVTIAKVSISDIQEAATLQNKAEAAGKAIDGDQAKGAANASAVRAAATAAEAGVAAETAETNAVAAKRNALTAASKTETARARENLARQRIVDTQTEIAKLNSKINQLPTDDTKSRSDADAALKQLKVQQRAAELEAKEAADEVIARQPLQIAAEANFAALAAIAGKNRAAADIARKTAGQKKTWESLVATGIASRAAQLPAKANACVVAMGK